MTESDSDPVFHIYSNNECIYHSLTEKQFKVTWEMLNSLVGHGTALENKAKFSYEKITAGIGGAGGGQMYKEPDGGPSF